MLSLALVAVTVRVVLPVAVVAPEYWCVALEPVKPVAVFGSPSASGLPKFQTIGMDAVEPVPTALNVTGSPYTAAVPAESGVFWLACPPRPCTAAVMPSEPAIS